MSTSVSTEHGSAHDPLCPGLQELQGYRHHEPGFVRNCQCKLITQVRAEEQGNCDEKVGITSVRAARLAYADAIYEALEVLRNLQHKPGADITHAIRAIKALGGEG